MELITVSNCILCEDVRPEAGGRKATLVGFLGVLPNVEIYIADLKLPVRQIALLFMMNRGGTTRVGLRIIDPNGTNILPPSYEAGIPVDAHEGSNLVVGLQGVSFPVPGKYSVQLIVENAAMYESTFQVFQGMLSDHPVQVSPFG